jgi:hypothetical protein
LFKRRRTRKQGRGARDEIPVFGIRTGNDVDKPVTKKELVMPEFPLRQLREYKVRLPSKPMRSRGMTASHVAVITTVSEILRQDLLHELILSTKKLVEFADDAVRSQLIKKVAFCQT